MKLSIETGIAVGTVLVAVTVSHLQTASRLDKLVAVLLEKGAIVHQVRSEPGPQMWARPCVVHAHDVGNVRTADIADIQR